MFYAGTDITILPRIHNTIVSSVPSLEINYTRLKTFQLCITSLARAIDSNITGEEGFN